MPPSTRQGSYPATGPDPLEQKAGGDDGEPEGSSTEGNSSLPVPAEDEVLHSVWRFLPLAPLAAVQLVVLADQQVIPVNMTAVALDLGIEKQARDQRLGGGVATVFFAAGAAASLLVGRLADWFPRVRLLSALTLVGAVAAMANAAVTSYIALLACRAGSGVAVGGVLPTLYSLVGDLFEANDRPAVTAMLGISAGAGPVIGQALAGLLGPSVGWRLPFVILGMLSCLSALVLPAIFAEPRRGQQDAPTGFGPSPLGVGEETNALEISMWCRPDGLHRLMGTPTVLLVFLQGAFGCIAWSVILTFLTDFLAVDGELGVMQATAVTFSFGLSSMLGVAAGGRAGGWLYARDKRLLPALMSATSLGGMVPLLVLLLSPGLWMGRACLCHFLAGLAGCQISVTPANVKAILLNASLPGVRGLAFGIYNLTDDLGKGLGPAVIALCTAAFGRQLGFAFGIACFAPCAVCLALMGLTIIADVDTVNAESGGGSRASSTEMDILFDKEATPPH